MLFTQGKALKKEYWSRKCNRWRHKRSHRKARPNYRKRENSLRGLGQLGLNGMPNSREKRKKLGII